MGIVWANLRSSYDEPSDEWSALVGVNDVDIKVTNEPRQKKLITFHSNGLL